MNCKYMYTSDKHRSGFRVFEVMRTVCCKLLLQICLRMRNEARNFIFSKLKDNSCIIIIESMKRCDIKIVKIGELKSNFKNNYYIYKIINVTVTNSFKILF